MARGPQTPDPGDATGEAKRDERAALREGEMHSADHPAWEALARAIRRQTAACVEIDAPASRIESLVAKAEALAEEIEGVATGKRFGLVESGWAEGGIEELDGMNYLPFSPIMGHLNPASYALELHREGDRAVGRVTLDETAEGAMGLAHGGVISGIWDEVLAAANALHGVGGPTGSLTIRYRRPTPLYEPLRYSAWIDRIDARKVLVSGECRIEGRDEVLTEGEGIFILLRQTGIDWHKQGRSDQTP